MNNMTMNRRQFMTHQGAVLSAMLTSGTSLFGADKMPDYEATGVQLINKSTPREDGFYYPSEWTPHDYTIMVMPPPQNWQDYGIPMADVRAQWADVANQLSEFEPVFMVVRPRDRRAVDRLLSDEIEIIELSVNDGWSRDSGPMFVVNDRGDRRVAGFTFNGWGEKFPPFADDALLKARLCKHLDVAMYPIDLVLEGGAITVDGEGTLITTEQCLLNKNRNPLVDRRSIEKILHESLGTEKVIWLGKGLEPDTVTDGHIDGIAAFAAPGVVLLHTTDDRSDRNYPICRDAKRRLQQATDAKGRKLEVVELPLDADLSHMNFYIGNGCVLVPVTSRRRENTRALAILREMFPDRKVISIDSMVLAEGGGGIHCITQQVPKVTLRA